MNVLELKSVLKLRRDNDYNYNKVKDTFVPYNGEVVLVDTATTGLRAKIGDGVNSYGKLGFVDEIFAENIIVRGYLFKDEFYLDADLDIKAKASVNKIYININDNKIYIYDGEKYISLTQTISAATPFEAGVVKLYNTRGQNVDGTMTQKAITDELNEKVEIEVDAKNEMVSFFTDIF